MLLFGVDIKSIEAQQTLWILLITEGRNLSLKIKYNIELNSLNTHNKGLNSSMSLCPILINRFSSLFLVAFYYEL